MTTPTSNGTMAMTSNPLKTVSGLDTSVHGARARIPYDEWAESTGLPIYGGNVVPNPFELRLAPWPLIGMDTAFVQLEGMPTVCEGRVSELAPGASSTPLRQAVGEIVYVLSGSGSAEVWSGAGRPQTIAWQTASLFVLPRNVMFRLSNSGQEPARLFSYNYRPLAMTSLPDVNLHFNGPWEEPALLGSDGQFFAAPVATASAESDGRGGRDAWQGNFFEDLRAWDELAPDRQRGVSADVVRIEFPGAQMSAHMSVIGPQTYNKAIKHGPGRIVILVAGEGMGVIMAPRGWENSELYRSEEKAGITHTGDPDETRIISPLQEGSFFAVPDDWYHQHFNTGSGAARFLVLHPLPQFAGGPYRHQMEYGDEDAWVRETFEHALAEKGLPSAMPEAAYQAAPVAATAGEARG